MRKTMRTFQLIAKEVKSGDWSIQWKATEGEIIPAEMHWIFSVATHALLDATKKGIILATGELLLPSQN